MDLQLDDRVILVVGGTGLIGSAVVDRLRQENATVIVASRHATDGVTLDAADEDSIRRGIGEILQQYGRIDGLVVAAAPAAQTLDPARSSDPAQVLSATDAKALAFLRVAGAVIPAMRDAGYGRIVAISGQNAYLTGNITGAVRNAATIVIAKNLADELAGTGVTVNVINPGTVTPDPEPEVQLARGGESSPTQIADLTAFLTSPLSSISGESIATGHRVRGVIALQ
jgi:NAD(P)-dependent dehydrogenase (short-subunit alcohol dehydrogenase family)